MDSLYLVIIFSILTDCHGNAQGAYEESVNCKGHNNSEGLFSCFYEKYHKEKGCMKVIKKFMQRARLGSPTNECLVEHSKSPCKKGDETKNCTKETCKFLLSFCIESLRKQRSEKSGKNGDEVTTNNTRNNTLDRNKDNTKESLRKQRSENSGKNGDEVTTNNTRNNTLDRNKDNTKESLRKQRSEKSGKNGDEVTTNNTRNNTLDRNKDNTKEILKHGAIVGISVGITGTIILFLLILITIVVCRRRSKKKKRKQLTKLQSSDQINEMENLKSGPSSTKNEGNNNLSTNKPVNTEEAQGEYFVLDPSVTKYDKVLNRQVLPEVTRFSFAESDENFYYEIDEDKIELSKHIQEDHQQRQIEDVRDISIYYNDQTINIGPLVYDNTYYNVTSQ